MNKKALILTCLLISTFLILQLPQVLPQAPAQAVDVEICGVRGYPFTETLNAPGTPPHKINIVVGLLANASVTCNVYIFDNMKLLTILTVNLAPNVYEVACYETTTNALGKGRHTLSALAALVTGNDTNSSNNYYVGNTIQIGIAGDVNLDGYVGGDDVVLVAKRVNNTGTISPIWVPEVDANLDGYIGCDDVVYFAIIGDLNSVALAAHAFGSEGTHSNDFGLPFAWIYDQYRDGVINMQDIELVASLFGSSDP